MGPGWVLHIPLVTAAYLEQMVSRALLERARNWRTGGIVELDTFERREFEAGEFYQMLCEVFPPKRKSRARIDFSHPGRSTRYGKRAAFQRWRRRIANST